MGLPESTHSPAYSLEQLATLSGVAERQIRALIGEGIVPRPSSQGRGASYGSAHLERLKAWRVLSKEMPRGTTLQQVRELVDQLAASPGLLRAIGEGTIPFRLIDDGKREVRIAGFERPESMASYAHSGAAPADAAAADSATSEGASGQNEQALAYLRSVSRKRAEPLTLFHASDAEGSGRGRTAVGASLAGTRGVDAEPLRQLVLALRQWTAGLPPLAKRAEVPSEIWHTIPVGRDLRIDVRGPLREDELAMLGEIGRMLEQAIRRRRDAVGSVPPAAGETSGEPPNSAPDRAANPAPDRGADSAPPPRQGRRSKA